MVQTGSKGVQTSSKWFKIGMHCSIWFYMVQYGSIWLKMVQNGPNWSKVGARAVGVTDVRNNLEF